MTSETYKTTVLSVVLTHNTKGSFARLRHNFLFHFLISRPKEMPKVFISVANVGRKVLVFAKVVKKKNADMFEIERYQNVLIHATRYFYNI